MWRRYRDVRRRPGVLRISWGVLCALHRASKKWHLAAPGGSSSLKNLYSYPSYDLRFRTQRNVQGILSCVPCRMALRGSRAGIYALRDSRAVATRNRRCGQHGAPRRSKRILGTHTNHCTTRKRTETPIPDLAGSPPGSQARPPGAFIGFRPHRAELDRPTTCPRLERMGSNTGRYTDSRSSADSATPGLKY